MAMYLIGDIQGCDEPLGRLLQTLDFSPSRDTLYLLGDLVNRGPQSLQVLRRLQRLGPSAQCLLGNHDLNLLAVSRGLRKLHRKDTLLPLLQAGDAPDLLDWLRHQNLALWAGNCLMVHAGVLPQWDADDTLRRAAEVEAVLTGPDWTEFLAQMYGNSPSRWHDSLRGTERLRVIVNALTRLRFCSAEGDMEFESKEGADSAPVGYMPWFEVPGRRTQGTQIAFGHWSTLGWLDRKGLYALDSGCVWGGCLTALRLGSNPEKHERIQVKCMQAQDPLG